MRGVSGSPERRASSASASLASVGAEIFLQQVDHRPQMAAFLDVDLEQVAQVIERGRGLAEIALLLDGRPARCRPGSRSGGAAWRGIRPAPPARPSRHGVAPKEILRLQPAAQAGCPICIRASSHNRTSPSPLGSTLTRGAQIDQRLLEALRPHVVPPVDIARCHFSSAFCTRTSALRSTLLGIRPL